MKQEKHNSIKLLTKTKLDRVMEAITDNPTDIKAFHQLSFLKDGKESAKKLEVKRRHLKTEKKKKQKRLQRSRKKSSLSKASKKVKIFKRSLQKAQVSTGISIGCH